MRARLLELLRCPACGGRLESSPLERSSDGHDVIEGILSCACGSSYPVIGTIPRMLPNAYALFPDFVARHGDKIDPVVGAGRQSHEPLPVSTKTQNSFGYQWTTFSEMSCDFRDNFWNYLTPATPEFLNGRLGLDAGCGFGRHLYHAADCGAEMIGMDFSLAIEASHANTRQFPNVHLVQGDIYAPPFAPGTFDFVYSVGVLHHLPDPERGVQSLVPLVRQHGSMFVWLYSSTRRVTNFILEVARAVTTRMPYPAVKGISFVGAVFDSLWTTPYQVLSSIPGVGRVVDRITPPRIKLYSRYPFQVLHADWFDRLAAPIRFYYSGAEVADILETAGLTNVRVAPTGLYGWRGVGVRSHE